MKRKPIFILIPILLLAALPYVVMLLWNHTVSELFSISRVTYWQALGLFVLSRLLFGNFNFGRKHKPPFFSEKLKENWMNLSDEEKQKLKEEWKRRRNC